MEFKILGALEITHGSENLELRGARQQVVIAMLLLNANKPVTMGRLLEALYGEGLPPTARSQAQISISSLRRLFASYSDNTIISTHSGGYAIRARSGELDAVRFEELITQARKEREAKNRNRAIAKYRDAIRLWRGPALDGIESQLIRTAAIRLDELYISTNEDRIALEIELGRHHEIVGELVELVNTYPLREELRAQLMLALYRCDRIAEALQVYQDTRATMIEELGIEPSDRLQNIQRSILTSDPGLDLKLPEIVAIRSEKQRVPNLLPADIADFTGRETQIETIKKHLSITGRKSNRAVPVAVLIGKGGIGKTALAVHTAHVSADYFPDGKLFADLHGAGTHPVSPVQVLERFIRAFGVQGNQIPEGVDEQAEIYRNLLADRKILVILDNAASESQVSPLLPGSGTAGVIITSRRGLTGIAGALRVELDVLPADKSVELLARIADPERVHAQPEATAVVAARCAHLPLALRIAGARLAARPHWSVQHLADRLSDEAKRLDELKHGDMGIRASISLTYENASEPARQLFRRLALLDMPVISGWLSVALLNQRVDIVEDLLDELVNVQLLEVVTSGSGLDSQYRFHDLIRVFARERLAVEESTTERRASLKRALGALLSLAEKARINYYGSDYARLQSDAQWWALPKPLPERLTRNPLEWYERERGALVAGVRQAAKAGLVELCWSLASNAVPLFESRVYLDDWRETHDVALEAARKSGDFRGQATMLYHIGSLHTTQLQFDAASQDLSMAVQLFEKVGDNRGIAHATFHMATIDRLHGRLEEASSRYEEAMAVFAVSGDGVAMASVLHGLAQVKLERGETRDAMDLLSEALRLCQSAHYSRLEAQILHRMGEAYLITGELARSVDAFEKALLFTREIGDVIGNVYILGGLGVAKMRQGELNQAHDALQSAAHLANEINEQMAEARALLGLCELELASGDVGQAVLTGQRAMHIFAELKAPLFEARSLTLISQAHAALGEVQSAHAATESATALRAMLSGDSQAS